MKVETPKTEATCFIQLLLSDKTLPPLSGHLPPALTRLATRVRRILAATLNDMVPTNQENPSKGSEDTDKEDEEAGLRKNRKLPTLKGIEKDAALL